MKEDHKNVCSICHQPERITSRLTGELHELSVDHCHITGNIRGLLCRHCNAGLGLFKDNIELLEKALSYLKSYDNTSNSNCSS